MKKTKLLKYEVVEKSFLVAKKYSSTLIIALLQVVATLLYTSIRVIGVQFSLVVFRLGINIGDTILHLILIVEVPFLMIAGVCNYEVLMLTILQLL